MDIEDCFDIVYQLEKVDGINQYCRYLNYGPSKRDKIIDTNDFVVFRHSLCGYRYQMNKKKGFVTIKNSYKANPDYRELTLSNGLCRSSLEIIGNKIIHKQKGKKEKITIRQLYRTHMIETKTIDKTVTLTKYYRALGFDFLGTIL
ncbi:hypothetical protein PVAND_011331 [Polypedilum vanderplanki]|uniref:Uncharacterized protein n=1 Tax=Polypedilum vanderplanki TaxID=319348 RepID=A0A9J6CJ44_POLVA|nr:hypothetical protein PVAND_011331 [Polypedilum vanderplanki]